MEGKRRRPRLWMFLALVPMLGCAAIAGLPSQIMYVIHGHKVSAEYDGLRKKRVAVVCVSDASAYGPNTLTYTVERRLAERLKQNIKKISIVPQSAIDDWKDKNGWDEENFYQIGRGVNAEMVVAIEISSYSLHDGQTMYKGRTSVSTTVFDMQTGTVCFRRGPEEYIFPKSGQPAIQNTDRQFEELFLNKLCDHLGRRFYEFEQKDTIAEDAGI